MRALARVYVMTKHVRFNFILRFVMKGIYSHKSSCDSLKVNDTTSKKNLAYHCNNKVKI